MGGAARNQRWVGGWIYGLLDGSREAVAHTANNAAAEAGKTREHDGATKPSEQRDDQEVERPLWPRKLQRAAHFKAPGRSYGSGDVVRLGKVLQGERKGICGRLVVLQDGDWNRTTAEIVGQALCRLLGAVAAWDKQPIHV